MFGLFRVFGETVWPLHKKHRQNLLENMVIDSFSALPGATGDAGLGRPVLCGGLLSGKYGAAAHAPPAEGARFVKFDDYMARWHPKHAQPATLEAAEEYAAIAARADLSPTQLAILWCRTRPFVAHGSVIVGATSLEQLKHNLDAFLLPAAAMSEEVEAEINAVHLRCRDPSSSL